MPPRAAPLPRSAIKRRGRKASETLRVYGPPSRRAWVRSLPCAAPGCGWTPCDNAHTITGGTGRKADAETIVPLCRVHHQAFDQHRAPFNDRGLREALRAHAAVVELGWQAHENLRLAMWIGT